MGYAHNAALIGATAFSVDGRQTDAKKAPGFAGRFLQQFLK
jgi:hypothetical protein